MAKTNRAAWTITALSLAVAAIASGSGSGAFGSSASDYAPVLATPFGIRTEALGKAQGWGLDKDTAAGLVREEIAYADLKGHTLYTYDKDPAGQSACVDECAKTWIPMVALPNAAPFGEWSVILRPDGARQWAIKGKALYSFVKDEEPGAVAGINIFKTMGRGPDVGSRGYFRGKRPKPGVLPEGWHAALLYPNQDTKLPIGFAVHDSPDAGGLILNDVRARTLYLFDGDPNQDQKACTDGACSTQWIPLAAPEIAQASGDFAFVNRRDGIHQWTYKGHGLYTFAGDLVAGDVNGMSANPHWAVAQLVRYYMPDDVVIEKTTALGNIFATKAGQTLYRRDGWLNQSGGGHSFPHGQANRPAVGRDIGTNSRCHIEQFDTMYDVYAANGNDCNKVWRPYLAPKDAQPSGFWDIATRDDGTRQWVYSGYAMWTYAGDKKPGEINGNDTFDFIISEDPNKEAEVGTQVDGIASLYWNVAAP